MRFYWLVLGMLATWRITHLFQAEDGPWDIMARLRRRVGNGFWGKLLDCFYCLSFWVAAPLAFIVGETWPERLLLWPALSGGAILLERATDRGSGTEPAQYWEDEDVVLRKEQTAVPGNHSRSAGE
jgi:hypothetical protein